MAVARNGVPVGVGRGVAVGGTAVAVGRGVAVGGAGRLLVDDHAGWSSMLPLFVTRTGPLPSAFIT